ncbi:MAG TPA: ribosome small subunit-dependent GTPase A [Gaiellaceae bacterium]
MTGFDLSGLGWTAELAASLEAPLRPGRVAVQHRGGFVVYTEDGERRVRLPGRAHHVGVEVAVGDWVALDADLIRAVLPRRSAIARQAAGRETGRQVLAANVDVAFLVTSFGPDLEPRRLERYLASVWESGASPVVLLTKADLEPNAREVALEVESVAVGVPVHVVSVVSGEGVDEVEAYLRPGVTAVLLGSSGVGKSTLANHLADDEHFRTRPVREDDGAGRHTTTHRELVSLPGGGLLIDTPGLRELQLWSGDGTGFEETFADVEELAGDCRFSDCSHTREPDCAVLAAVDEGTLPLDRLRSYRKLERELRWATIRQDARLRQEERRRWHLLTRDAKARTRRR